MSNVPLPRPGHLGLIQYAGSDMQEYAAAVSAAKDAEIVQLRTELLKSLADNAPLRERAMVLEASAKVADGFSPSERQSYIEYCPDAIRALEVRHHE